ncbi:Homocysteine S-methyltransferase [Periconia macrospinosa]|uniref:Homocysteine S-methyltransferase n=1 Tax=Periconia macrospinosa TaxID=97972 RepID=A0A2V1EEL1_9PLEO|nr:Homocysteine S-methyltransferase [Periconia macrospinosa]
MTTPSNPSKTKNKLSTILAENEKPIVLDGALATYLETLGADISSALWSAHLLTTSPSLIKRTHLDYFHAGATIAITSSYQASVPGLTKHLSITPAEARALICKSVDLAREARDEYVSILTSKSNSGKEDGGKKASEDLLIAGSVGPYGAYLADGSEYTGSYSGALSMDEFKDFHRERIDALMKAGVDVLAIETIPSFTEAQALVSLLEDEFPEAEAWFSFTLAGEDETGTRIADGTRVSDVLALLESYRGVVAVGVNCVGEDVAARALVEMGRYTKKPLVVYPNSGEVWDAEGRKWDGERTGGKGVAERTRALRKAGARIVGGCCRCTPEDIKVVAETLRGE